MKHRLSTFTLAALVLSAAALGGCDSHQVKLGPAGKAYAAWPFDAAEAVRRQQETAGALGLTPQKTLDLGGVNKTVLAGIAKAYTPDDLLGKIVICLANLKPRKMKFGLSEGMILAAGTGGKDIFMLTADAGAAPGQKVLQTFNYEKEEARTSCRRRRPLHSSGGEVRI